MISISWLNDWASDARDWCRGKNIWARAPLLAYLLYAGVRHLADPLYRSWFAGITLGIHELGHIVFGPAGRTMQLLGGSIFQLLAPAAAAVYLLVRQRDYFGLCVGAAWLSFSEWELATYVGDASHENLPLVSLGDSCVHDWAALLAGWHLLNYDWLFAATVRVAATITWGGAVAGSAWLFSEMWKSRGSGPAT